MKKSKIIRIESITQYKNDHGTTHYHNLEMENGDKINIGKKKEQQVGWELIYEVVDGGQEYNKSRGVSKADWDKINPDTPPYESSNKHTAAKQQRTSNVSDEILYQSTMKEVMGYVSEHGFDQFTNVSNDSTLEDKFKAVSAVCLYLAKQSKLNIRELNKL